MKPIRVLVVDDSAAMRAVISASLARDPGIAIVGEAADPFQAREAIKSLNPDVMTLDVEMPGMDGLSFLEKVMRLRPLPVVMVSSLTSVGASATIAALELGAVDCVAKPAPGNASSLDALPAVVRTASVARLERNARSAPKSRAVARAYEPDGRVVALGASTGGVEALISIVSQFPANCPPTVIVIHMPQTFTGSFSRRLDSLSAATVHEATDGAPLEVGKVYVARGGTHLAVMRRRRLECKLLDSEPINGHRPSVDKLFQSVASECGRASLGVILTGMGRDGAAGLLAMRKAGATTFAQNEATCVIYGMPKAAVELGAVQKSAPLHLLSKEILDATRKNIERRAI